MLGRMQLLFARLLLLLAGAFGSSLLLFAGARGVLLAGVRGAFLLRVHFFRVVWLRVSGWRGRRCKEPVEAHQLQLVLQRAVPQRFRLAGRRRLHRGLHSRCSSSGRRRLRLQRRAPGRIRQPRQRLALRLHRLAQLVGRLPVHRRRLSVPQPRRRLDERLHVAGREPRELVRNPERHRRLAQLLHRLGFLLVARRAQLADQRVARRRELVGRRRKQPPPIGLSSSHGGQSTMRAPMRLTPLLALCALAGSCARSDYAHLYRPQPLAPGYTSADVAALLHLGATRLATSINFSVYSEHATKVQLLIFDDPESNHPTRNFDMSRYGDVWNVFVEGVGVGTDYGYIAWGPNWPYVPSWKPGTIDGFLADVDAAGNRFNPNKLLFDPYSRAFHRDHDWSKGSVTSGPSAPN